MGKYLSRRYQEKRDSPFVYSLVVKAEQRSLNNPVKCLKNSPFDVML